jgi:hypothetical protein
MQRSIRDFAQSRRCPKPLVRVMLDDGERLYLQALAAGPDDDFVTLSVYDPDDEMTRVVVLRLDAIRKVELLKKPPSAAEKAFVFQPRSTAVGFAV